MVALGILVVLVSILVLFCYRYMRARWQLYRASRKPADPEALDGLPDIAIPHWSSTADLVTTHFAQLELLYDPQPPARRCSTATAATGLIECGACAFCRRTQEGYEARHQRSRPVVRAHEDCGSDVDLPKYTAHPTASCPRLIADDIFPPPPTPPPEAHVHVSADGEAEGLDLTAAVAAIQAADRAREMAERETGEMQRRNSERSTTSTSTNSSQEGPTPPPRARRWTLGAGNKPKDISRRPRVTLANTTFVMVPL